MHARFIQDNNINSKARNGDYKLSRQYAKISQSICYGQLAAIDNSASYTVTRGLTTFMRVSGKSWWRLTAAAEAIITNDEQSINKETADIFSSSSLLRPSAYNRSERKALTKWWRNIYLKAEMISRGWKCLLRQLVTCLWRPLTNNKIF